jgi:SH3-like domain-containing protein
MNILEILRELNDMDFSEISINAPDFNLKVKRKPAEKVVVQEMIEDMEGFSKAADIQGLPGMASPKQVKYAVDLMKRAFGEDEREAFDFVAHMIGLPIQDVPEYDQWATVISQEDIGIILDKLEVMCEIPKKGRR